MKALALQRKCEIKWKKQPTKLEKIFANEVTDKGLIFKICKQFMKLNIKETNGTSPGGPLGKIPCSQCRGPEFDPWSGN